MFADQVEFLSKHFRVIAYDHRGQGKSESKGPFDMDTVAEDAAALIEKLDLGPVHFVGLSMGGFLGMRLAARRPDLIASLALLETSANAEPVENLPKYKTLNGIVKWVGVISPVANKVMAIMFAMSWLSDKTNSPKISHWKKELMANKRSITGPVEGVIYRKGVEDELAKIFSSILNEKGVSVENNKLIKIVSSIKERANFVSDFWELADYFFVAPTSYDEKAAKNWKEETPALMKQVIAVLESIEDFTSLNIETILKDWMTTNEIGMGKVMQPLRLSLVGALKGPHLFDIIELIGKEETVKRIEKAMTIL